MLRETPRASVRARDPRVECHSYFYRTFDSYPPLRGRSRLYSSKSVLSRRRLLAKSETLESVRRHVRRQVILTAFTYYTTLFAMAVGKSWDSRELNLPASVVARARTTLAGSNYRVCEVRKNN